MCGSTAPASRRPPPDLVGRIYRVSRAGQRVAELEAGATQGTVTVERIQRRNALVGVDGNLALEAGDVLLVGRRAAVVSLGGG